MIPNKESPFQLLTSEHVCKKIQNSTRICYLNRINNFSGNKVRKMELIKRHEGMGTCMRKEGTVIYVVLVTWIKQFMWSRFICFRRPWTSSLPFWQPGMLQNHTSPPLYPVYSHAYDCSSFDQSFWPVHLVIVFS